MTDKTEEKIKEVLERTNYQYYFGIEDLPEIREDSIELFIRHTVSNLLSVFNEELRQTKAEYEKEIESLEACLKLRIKRYNNLKAECLNKVDRLISEAIMKVPNYSQTEAVLFVLRDEIRELQKADEMFKEEEN